MAYAGFCLRGGEGSKYLNMNMKTILGIVTDNSWAIPYMNHTDRKFWKEGASPGPEII